jgi:CBS domain-containing protein
MTALVRDVMTHLVVSFRPRDTIEEAAHRLLANRISGAPVVSAGKVVGVVSEVDVASAAASPHASVEDAMTREVVTVPPDAPVGEAAILMDRHSVRRLPVVDADGYLCGVIARADVVRALANEWRDSGALAGTL